MEIQRKTQIDFYVHSGIPRTKAEVLLRENINREVRSRDILTDVRIEQNPRGNKQWEIVLVLQDPGSDSECTGIGYFACHMSKGFVTYSITLEGREYWFDKYQAALSFLGFSFESEETVN